tara:strand:+ start:750 stop:1208 length:459 start_codon:yes stop_codon:yes gene_type:complete
LAFIKSINIKGSGGVPKTPVNKSFLGKENVSGDQQNDLKHHGGVDRAVCLFSIEIIEALKKEGHPIYPGSTGENLTIEGIDWSLMTSGATLSVGEAKIELTWPAPPCKTIKDSFTDGQFIRISEKKNPGFSRWYARVLKEGLVCKNDKVIII